MATDGVDSMMELERPGEAKKNRCEAKTVAKSGSDPESGSDSERVESEECVRVIIDLEVESKALTLVLVVVVVL